MSGCAKTCPEKQTTKHTDADTRTTDAHTCDCVSSSSILFVASTKNDAVVVVVVAKFLGRRSLLINLSPPPHWPRPLLNRQRYCVSVRPLARSLSFGCARLSRACTVRLSVLACEP